MKTVSNIWLVFFIGLMTICCVPYSINAQQLPLLSADSKDNSGGRTILLGLTAGNSQRPSIQFSENTNSITTIDGMSIEYDGRGFGSGNKLNINNTTNSPIFTLLNNGDASNTGKFSTNSLEVAGDTRLTDDTNGTGATPRTAYLPGHIFISPYNNGTNISYLQARREDTSGDTQLNIRTTNNGTLVGAMQIKKDGDVDVLGYTKFGSVDAPAIRVKKFTGTTENGSSTFGAIVHNLDASKIISITGTIDVGSNTFYNASDWVLALWNATTILFQNKTNSTNNLPITFTVVYQK